MVNVFYPSYTSPNTLYVEALEESKAYWHLRVKIEAGAEIEPADWEHITPEIRGRLVEMICLRKIQSTNSATPEEPTQETT